ncbi:MAG: hypothetical protein MJ244_06310 [Clostridia bacterium]|nr:hypothetical protein [Clostridia bacterium]
MSTREANIALLSTIPENVQQHIYLTNNYCNEKSCKPLTADEIYSDLAKSRECYNTTK